MSPCWCCWRSRAALCQAHRMEAKQHLLGVVLGISERPRTRVLLSQGAEMRRTPSKAAGSHAQGSPMLASHPPQLPMGLSRTH